MFSIIKTVIKAIFGFITNRLFLLLLIVIGLFYILVQAIFQLTIIDGEKYTRDFEASVVREVDTEGQRGNIYDRNGYPLAENVIAYNVLLNDSVVVEDKNAMIHELVSSIKRNGDVIVDDFPLKLGEVGFEFEGTDKQILNFKRLVFNRDFTSQLTEEEVAMSPYGVFLYMRDRLFRIDKVKYSTDEVLDILTIRYAQYIKRYSKYQPEVVAENISQETLALIEEKRDIFPGVTIVESPFRVYNDAPYFAHIIGYTREIDADRLELMEPLGYESDDKVGVIGIEEEMEAYLRGYDGYQKVEVNNVGRTMLVLEEVQPVIGNDVYLTIDRDLQIRSYHILEQQMAEILYDKIRMTPPVNSDESHVLFKEVFDSIFRYDLIDTRSFTDENIYEDRLLTKKNDEMERISAMITEEIESDSIPADYDNYGAVYRHFLEAMKQDGLLDTKYRSSEAYLAFKESTMSFHTMIDQMASDGTLLIPDSLYVTDSEGNKTMDSEAVFHYIFDYITKELMYRYDYDAFIYRFLIDREAFDYLDLTLAIVNQQVVTCTEEEMDLLLRRRLTPIQFMKNKILALEMTPHELALDPSSGSVVISDSDTGEVLAMVSYPTYDNSRLVNNFDNAYYAELLRDPTSPLYPRATYSKSAPGSAFKMAAAMISLEEDVVKADETYYAGGIYTKAYGDPVCWIHSRGGIHGNIDAKGAIEESCNVFFYEMGYRLNSSDGAYSNSKGISIIEDYIARFGLDSKTGIEVGEINSTLPSNDSIRAMIGQDTHSYTPVQLTRYMNVIANDGVVKELNLLDKVLNKSGETVQDFTPSTVRVNDFEKKHIDLVKEGMLAVTEGASGSAKYYFRDLDLQVAGKTGTAQVVSSRPSHAVFVSFAPYDDPEVSVVSVIQFGYGSKYAALNTKKVYEMYFELKQEREGYSLDHMLE